MLAVGYWSGLGITRIGCQHRGDAPPVRDKALYIVGGLMNKPFDPDDIRPVIGLKSEPVVEVLPDLVLADQAPMQGIMSTKSKPRKGGNMHKLPR